MSYTCVYDRTIFHNPTNKYSVIRVKTNDSRVPEKARSPYTYRDKMIRFIAVGYDLPLTDKVSMLLDGEWVDGKYGQQLQVERCEEIVPQTIEGVRGYLSSQLIKGVGPAIAGCIVDRFGSDTLQVLENEPERLLEIKGITPTRLKEIVASYTESRCLRNLMILLSPFQITPVTATRIYNTFGARSVDVMKENPYELCRLPGFGFKRVDAIVRKGDLPLNATVRIRGAIYSALDTQHSDRGHLYMGATALLKDADRLLNERVLPPQTRVVPNEIAAVLEDMILKGEVVSTKERIYQTSYFVQEDEAARCIAKLMAEPMEKEDIETALTRVRKELGITLSQRQSEAVYMAFRSNLSIITGSPGTGKTTVLRTIIEVYQQLYPQQNIVLTAPTGLASRRMADSTGKTDAKTLHSLMKLGDGTYIREKGTVPIDAGLVIIDESSMVDMWLAQKLFMRIRPGTKVVLVGDVDQLQSVGAGDVFRELIRCGEIPVTVLREIFRQKKDSLIAHNAKKINEDDTNLYYGDDFRFIKCKTQEEAADIICQTYCEQVKQYGVDHVQILSPFRAEGLAAADQLNRTIREIVNPPTEEDIPDLKVGFRYFREGDRVMQTRNSAKAANGDVGFIRSIKCNDKNEMKVEIAFSENCVVEYGMLEMEHMELAYATTIHKSQGSEYDVVIIPVLRNHAIMLNRNLLYTAITRAKHKVILVGDKGMLFMAIHKHDAGNRNTLLGERINRYYHAFCATPPSDLKKVG